MSRFTDERNAKIVLGLLKANRIRKIVVSPGSTNIPISGSVQNDPYFEVYSSVDERSAAYMAVGLSEMSGEAVALSCTGATASRNYLPGLTEAFYRKLPLVAITSFTGNDKVGNLVPQIIDRNVLPNDSVKKSVQLPVVRGKQDEDHCTLLVNKALHAAFADGGGPVHINLPSSYTGIFNVEELPPVRAIGDLGRMGSWPDLDGKRVAIFIGSHRPFTQAETDAIEQFCDGRDAVVLCDHTSSYCGKYRVQAALVSANFRAPTDRWKDLLPDVVFHLGEVSGDYYGSRVLHEAPEVWRISKEHELRDPGHRLSHIFCGKITDFFGRFVNKSGTNNYFSQWENHDRSLREKLPELPYSNIWLAKQTAPSVGENSNVYLGILNSLRSWNFFTVRENVRTSSNVGGFGIDGCLSTLIGGALASPDKLNLAILGDLAFFYDINSLGNRHLGDNVRIMLVNNGCGVEFNNSSHIASRYKSGANKLMAAAGHFNSGSNGTEQILPSAERKQLSLAKAWCEARGITYLSASSKVEFLSLQQDFFGVGTGGPVIIECFTEVADESRALEIITSIDPTSYERAAAKAKKVLSPEMRAKARRAVKKLMT